MAMAWPHLLQELREGLQEVGVSLAEGHPLGLCPAIDPFLERMRVGPVFGAQVKLAFTPREAICEPGRSQSTQNPLTSAPRD